MSTLITGGAGFIGSHLAEELLNRGEEVYIIDDLSTGSIENVDHLRHRMTFHCIVDSIYNESLLAELIDRCDHIYHLAAAVGVRLIVESPVRTIETNVHGTEIVLRQAVKKKKKVVVASTSEVYGKSTQVPFREDADLVLGSTAKGRWSYACSKALDEFLALAYFREKTLPVVVCRLFNTVGPRQTGRYGMVVPSFVNQALFGQPITVFGDGKQSRCFISVRDVVKVLANLAYAPEAVGQVFNIGSNQEITIVHLAHLVKELSRSHSEIIYVPYDEAYEEGFEDMPRRVPDISKIQQLLQFTPTLDIGGIVKEVIEHCQIKIRQQRGARQETISPALSWH